MEEYDYADPEIIAHDGKLHCQFCSSTRSPLIKYDHERAGDVSYVCLHCATDHVRVGYQEPEHDRPAF